MKDALAIGNHIIKQSNNKNNVALINFVNEYLLHIDISSPKVDIWKEIDPMWTIYIYIIGLLVKILMIIIIIYNI